MITIVINAFLCFFLSLTFSKLFSLNKSSPLIFHLCSLPLLTKWLQIPDFPQVLKLSHLILPCHLRNSQIQLLLSCWVDRPVLFELYSPLSLTTTVFQVRFTHLSTCYHATKANLFNSLLSICHEISITKSTQSQLSLNNHAPHGCIICSLCLDHLLPNF